MKKYTDRYGRFHHKPTDGLNPSSGNGWLYTAYAEKVGLKLEYIKLEIGMSHCRIPVSNPYLVRNPGQYTPPISRDEILGMSSLDLLEKADLPNWNFSPYEMPKFSFSNLFKQLYDLRPSLKRHRNYFWENNLDQIYRFAFSVPFQDRYFILSNRDDFQFYNPIHLLYATISFIDSMLPKKSGIKFLKYGGKKNKMKMIKEFPSDHPIYLKVLYDN
jgi:hypothetical protein